MTRLAIDGKSLAPPRGGVGRYVEGLLDGLAALAFRDLSIEVVRPRKARRTLPWVLWQLQRVTGRGFDVVHFPFYYPPLAPRTAVTVAVHDVLFLDHPEWFPEGRRNPLRWLVPPGARRADAVVTFARATAAAISERCRVPAGRIRVIPHGVDRTRFAPADAARRQEVRRRHRLERPFLLQVGFLEPRRGLDLAVSATSALRAADPDLELVLVGELRSPVAALAGAPAWVRRLGGVADDELAVLYGAAEAVLAPSRGEGFDLPVLEALACGAAVVASDIPVHVELFTGAVELFADGDGDALAAAVERVRGDSVRRAGRLEAARRLAAGSTWEGSARAHAGLWREVAG